MRRAASTPPRQQLRNSWTGLERGPKWNLAVRVCIAVIADKMEAEEARKAFLAAAEEEGVLRSSD
ncbi:DUF982 domain-containing protein [Mesorhizobium sp.]|uniref:DUF982 domain-containing protein n=1 Tax=Mesorhizobium sp. TaxID=1871066 RepID=UPI00338DC713